MIRSGKIVDSISIEDYRTCVRGRLLGTMNSSVYVRPKEFLGMTATALRGSVWLYLLLLPFIYLRRPWRKLPGETTGERRGTCLIAVTRRAPVNVDYAVETGDPLPSGKKP